ncbi:MAG: hypothetical protein HOV77_20940 [Hamadaea sp.]|uniref:hypothetical protein n=1 Tax=Hamadaea sp. TaxID=2024425 RepID=UPI0017EF045B|nr:hypothetical protein [Hamadaea sp.]NUT21651.1 hypothetical protein [Hamadaea sp.]
MIVASLLLIVVAVVLLVTGLINGSSGMLVGSIGTSLLAAVALVVGARQAAAARAEADYDEDEQDESDAYEEAVSRSRSTRDGGRDTTREPEQPVRGRVAERVADRADQTGVTIPAQSGGAALGDVDDDEDPPDEPIAQRVPPADAARVARMSTEVLVIDGRPRYHVAGCVHLLGRSHEPLPVNEAVELGFSPCGLCEPDSALLADARRV